MERVLVDYNCVPIFFICKDENNRYLALNSEPDNSAYIVVKISDADAYDLLHGNIPMRRRLFDACGKPDQKGTERWS